MNVLERLKMELNNLDYLKEEEYKRLLLENGIETQEILLDYNKKTQQKALLLTVLDILQIISNDIDLMRKVSDETTGFTTEQAYGFLQKRMDDIRQRISTLEPQATYSNVGMLFTKGRR